jgi:hypothetical protein
LIAPPASAEKGKGISWLYSISQRTVTAFPSIRTTAARYQYANALRRQVMITENKIALADPFSDARVDAARIPGNRDTSAASIATSLRPQTQAPKAKPGQDEEKNADKTSSITTSGPTTAETKQPDTSPPPPKPGASLPKKSSAPAVAPTPEARPDKKPSLGTTSFQKENDKPNTSTTLKRKMDLSVTT